MRRRTLSILTTIKMKALVTFLIFGISTIAYTQELVNLGTIEGEFKIFRTTLSWTNDTDDKKSIKLWSSHPDLQFTSLSDSVRVGEQIELPVSIQLPQQFGDYEYELRLLDNNDFVIHGFQLTFKVLQGELDVFKAYRNIHWPFRTREEVFNLRIGRRGDTLKAVYDVYNLGGEDLDLSDVYASDSVNIFFEPPIIEHNQFGRVNIEFLSNNQSEVGFRREVVKLYRKDKLLTALPIQFTLLPNRKQRSESARLSSSIVNYDFKVMKVNEKKEAVVVLANNGNAPLQIEKIESNCDCLTFNNIERIESGRSQELRVIFNATGRLGLEKKTLAIFSNDPNRPVRVLTFKAHVK